MTLLILNILVTAILSIAYLPQLKTTYQVKSTEGVSNFFWTMISFSTAISLFNLLASGNAPWYIYLGQFINAGVAYLLFIWILKRKTNMETALVVAVGYALALYGLHKILPINFTQAFATAAIVAAYVDQIQYFIKKKSAVGTNPLLYFFFAIGLTILITIMLMTNASIHIIITEAVNIWLLITCGVLSHKLNKTK